MSPARIQLAFALVVLIQSVVDPPSSKDKISCWHQLDVECGKILPDCNLYCGKLHRTMADASSVTPAKRVDRLLKWHFVMEQCTPRGYLESFSDMRVLCEVLLAARMVDKLRVVLADYLQLMKLYFVFTLT